MGPDFIRPNLLSGVRRLCNRTGKSGAVETAPDVTVSFYVVVSEGVGDGVGEGLGPI